MKIFSVSITSISLLAFLITQNLAQDERLDPKLTEIWEHVPAVVTPGDGTAPPSDALVLFDGSNFDEWVGRNGGPVRWELKNGVMTVVEGAGGIRTRRSFGDSQLHLEWRAPAEVTGKGQERGNSGIFLQDRYEVQVLDSYNNLTYSNGQAASIYKQHIPLVNACRPPGVWQTYDIIFTSPRFKSDGSVQSPGRVTVIHNGVLVQNNVEFQGNTVFRGQPEYEQHSQAPIRLQDHSNPVSYRNIWIREL